MEIDFATASDGTGGEARVVLVAIAGERRVVFLETAGGMMDLGWAQRLVEPLAEQCRGYVDGAFDARTLRARLRAVLTGLESKRQLFGNAHFVALELGERALLVARIGGARVWICARVPRVVGTEDASILEATGVAVVTACVLPDQRWQRVPGRDGLVLLDERGDADRFGAAFREETVPLEPDDAYVVVAGPALWAGGFAPAAGATRAETFARLASDVETEAYPTAGLVVSL